MNRKEKVMVILFGLSIVLFIFMVKYDSLLSTFKYGRGFGWVIIVIGASSCIVSMVLAFSNLNNSKKIIH